MGKRRITIISCILLILVIGMSSPVVADTSAFNWRFSTAIGNNPALPGYKNDNEKRYYLTIYAGNLSKTNIFGTRIRRLDDDALASPYKLHTSYKTSQPYSYSISVDTHTRYYLRGKKDDSSTSTADLTVLGRITY